MRQTLTAPLAGALQSAFAGGGGLFGLLHEGGVAGERPPAVRYADASVFEHAPRYHGGGFAGSGLPPDEVPIIARRGELVVPPERVVREEKTVREQRRITVVVMSLPLTRAPFVQARARSRPTWRARSTGRAGTGDQLPRGPFSGQHRLWRDRRAGVRDDGGGDRKRPREAQRQLVGGARRLDVASALKKQAQIDELIAFFRARRGKAYGFRFKDWTDYKATGPAAGDGR